MADRPLSSMSLRSKIKDDHLTCPICLCAFEKPKALPCLHTFCADCLRDHISSRGYEVQGKFPCPFCQQETIIPPGGVYGFPDNHFVVGLLDTVEKKPARPAPPVPMPPLKAGEHQGNQTGPPATIQSNPGEVMYPHLPRGNSIRAERPSQPGVCSKGLILKFGSYGGTIADLMKPYGFAVGKNGEYVVTDTSGNRILVYSYSGELLARLSCDCKISGVAMTKQNLILVAVNGAGSALMRVYNMDGKLLQNIGDHYRYDIPSGVALTPKNHIVVSNLEGNNIYVFTETYKLSQKFGWKGSGDRHFDSPNFVTVDSKDHIIVSDSGNDCIKMFDALGNFKRKFGSLCCPMGVTVDKFDNVIVADAGNFRVQAFDNKGNYLSPVLQDTDEIGPDVKPINVAMSRGNNIAVLLRGTQFAEIRVYEWNL